MTKKNMMYLGFAAVAFMAYKIALKDKVKPSGAAGFQVGGGYAHEQTAWNTLFNPEVVKNNYQYQNGFGTFEPTHLELTY